MNLLTLLHETLVLREEPFTAITDDKAFPSTWLAMKFWFINIIGINDESKKQKQTLREYSGHFELACNVMDIELKDISMRKVKGVNSN